jgi:hypothetical protein
VNKLRGDLNVAKRNAAFKQPIRSISISAKPLNSGVESTSWMKKSLGFLSSFSAAISRTA